MNTQGQGSCHPLQRRQNLRHESGAVLMVAMVMIFIISILGISAMRGATLEGQLANNSLQKTITFQSAESSTDMLLAVDNVLEDQICADDRTFDMPKANQIADKQNTSIVLQDGGETLAVGFEIGGPVSARRFVATGSSTLAGANTSTTIAQGVVLLGASDPTGGC